MQVSEVEIGKNVKKTFMPNYEMNYYDYGLTLSAERNMEPVLKYGNKAKVEEISNSDPDKSKTKA